MKCRSCDGQKQYRHSGSGCSGGPLYLDCTMCDGTGIDNPERYLVSRKKGLRISIENLTSAVARDKQKLKDSEEQLKSLETHLEQCKKELVALEGDASPPG